MVRPVGGRLLRKGRIGLLPAAYSPPTVAHLALGETAQRVLGLRQVVLVMARSMPHKRIQRPGFDERLEWLARLAASRPGWAACSCPTGLVVEVVDAFRAHGDPGFVPFVIAGRDAAERWVAWDYGSGEPFAAQLRKFRLAVGSRAGGFQPPRALGGRVHTFEMAAAYGGISSSAAREAIRGGDPWRHMVPEEIRDEVGEAYSRRGR